MLQQLANLFHMQKEFESRLVFDFFSAVQIQVKAWRLHSV